MSRTILFVGGGIEAVPGIRRAREMGLRVVVSDGSAEAPGRAAADDFLVVSTYDVEKTVGAANRYSRETHPLDGVICLGTDVPHTVAAVARALGLPGIPLESAALAIDKLAMKARFVADGVPVPWFAALHSAAHLADLLREGLPLVIKPVDSRGARGVLRLQPDTDPAWAFAYAERFSPSGRVMVERFLDGPQVSTESLAIRGAVHTPGFSDRNYELLNRYAPHIIENGGDLPSHLAAETQQAVCAVVADAARSLGIRDGVVKGDIVVHHGHPFVIEIAARLSGGYFCTHEIPLSTGVDFVGQAIRIALGEQPDPAELQPRYRVPVVQRYLFPTPGLVTAVSGVEEVARRPAVRLCEVRVQPGDQIRPPEAHPARAGVVITTGDSKEVALAEALAAVRDIHIETALAP